MGAPVIIDEEDLDQMWNEAQIEFQKISGRDPKTFAVLRVDEVIAKISQKKEADEKANARYKRAKDIVNKTLLCIQNLGSIAADAASKAFAPSTLCFNAVSYLITTAQHYSKIFDGVSDLFDRISAFLDRFEVYARSKTMGVQIDLHLRRIIHELLRSFMRICALSIKICKQSKVLLALEVFSFGTDKGVSEELSRLETLVQRETGMSVALILESVKVNESKVATGFAETKGSLKTIDSKVDGITGQLAGVSSYLEKAEQLKEADGLSKRNREKIKHALKIEKEMWRSDQEEFVRTLVPGSGEWLFTDPQFVAWVDKEGYADPILSFEAREGFGKSYLCSTAIRRLFQLYPPSNKEARVSVAYYFFQKDNKDEKSVNKALRAIIWQLTQHDAVYQKSVAGACDKPEEFGNTLELWKQLVVQFSAKTEATVFVVLDGIDEAETETGHPLIQILRDVSLFAAEKRPLSLRLLISGRPRSFLEINKTPNIAMSTIQLGTCNKEDILKYVEIRLETMEIFKKSDQSDIQELKERVRTELTDGARGDFFKLNYMLTEISKKRRRKEVEEVLEHADEDRQATIGREIERLRQTLGYEDIQDLNELLTWVIGAKQWPLLTTLEGALFVKNGENSLMPLEEQVREKYSALLEVSEYQTLTITSDSIIEHFRMKAQQEAVEEATHTALHESEVAIIKRFLRNVCDEELFNKFGFEEFFQRKLSHKSTSIHVDLENMHAHILLSSLKAICGEKRSEVTQLLEYSFYWLPDHLNEVDLALTPPGPKSTIGSQLIKLFLEEKYVDRWWTEERMWMRTWWVYDDDYSNIVLEWFKDSAVVKGLTEEQRKWVHGLTSSSSPDDDLLKPIAKIMAKRWLQTCGLWFVKDIYWWLLGYITKIQKRIGEGERVTGDVQPTLEQILDVEKWAMKELDVTEQDSLWAVQMAITLRHYGFYEQAIERSTISKNLEASNWRAQFCLAQTHALQGEYKPALEVLAEVIEMFRKDEKLMEQWCSVFYEDILYYLGEWNVELHEYEAAMEAFREIQAHDPDSYEPVLRIILILEAKEAYVEIIERLQSMGNEVNEEGLTRLVAMAHQYADSRLYHQTITKAGRAAHKLETIKETYQIAVEAAKSSESRLTALTALRYWYALSLYYDYPDHDAHEEAIAVWEQNVASIPRISNQTISNVRWSTVAKLASVYLQEAKEAGFNTNVAETYRNKLIFLSSSNRAASDDDYYLHIDAKLMLARFYHLMGDKQKAIETLRGHIKLALDILDDDDETNDWQGFKRLSVCLSHVDDDVNALAAWSLLGPILDNPQDDSDEDEDEEVASESEKSELGAPNGNVEEKDKETSSQTHAGEDEDDDEEEEETSEHVDGDALASALHEASANKPSPSNTSLNRDSSGLQGHLHFVCDGACGREWFYADDTYACKDCLDVQFGSECYEKLKAGTLEQKVCSKDHSFLYVPRWDSEAAEKVPEGHVRVGDDVIPIQSWLVKIRKEYGFD
ncbi:hypothetical protein PRK78_001279 [Emydomyces testavorans]|uniref:Fungal STAND N-terminal Goodbye domain-containing protein n=1 Tax=Emydomyces testavorans TaxID=2070801 RepID=A0AAF0DC82_9EURO|nr:hypothetical protein PRK78_001279 [Emydomyces testavorans]